MKRNEVNPEMVILARESRGYSQDELAKELHVTQGRISKIEGGTLEVPDDLLEVLCRVLHYPPVFFHQEGVRPGVGIAEIFHRKHKDVPKKLMNEIYASIDIRIRHITSLLRAAEIPERVPRLPIEKYEGNAAQVARLVRSMWDIPRGPIRNVTKTLEDAGVVVVSFHFGTRKVDGICRWLPGCAPVMFVSDEAPKDRVRLTEVHELAHMVMHKTPNPDIEDQAFAFAAEFLMPEREIFTDLQELSLQKLANLKQYWRVSMQSLLQRAKDLRTIPERQVANLWREMGAAGYRTKEPVDLDIQGEQPALLQELVDMHIKEMSYGVEELGQLLSLYEDELRSLYMKDSTRPSLRIIH